MKTKKMTLCALFVAMFSVCAWITVPFAIPFTLQTFALFLACLVLGGKYAALCSVIYMLIGVVGLPVFSGLNGGLGVLLGPTGGYIVGFPIMCLSYSFISFLFKNPKFSNPIGLILGLAVLYIFGTSWYTLGYTSGGLNSFLAAGIKCVLPFIIPDFVKMFLALIVSRRLSQTKIS